MSLLSQVRKGRQPRAPKIVVYGGPKVGKSTFGAGIPDAIFVQTEEGLDALDVHAFPLAKKYNDVLNALRELAREEHPYKAVVLDSLDWLEPIIWETVCSDHGVPGIEQVGGGYGKGYTEALGYWSKLLEALDYLRDERGMTVVLIAHDEVRKMEPVDGEAYDYAALKLHRKAAARVQEWADVIGYARTRTVVKSADAGFGKKHRRAIAPTDERELVVGQNPAYVTGNRYGMSDVVPLDWAAFIADLRASFAADRTTSHQENDA